MLQDKRILKCYIKLKPKKIGIEQRQERHVSGNVELEGKPVQEGESKKFLSASRGKGREKNLKLFSGEEKLRTF